MKKLILQVGRLDKQYQKPVDFRFNQYKATNTLSSLFLKESVPDFLDAELLIILPISIGMQPWDVNTQDPFLKYLLTIDLPDLLNNAQSVYERHPHVAGNKLLVVSSLGNYIFKEQEIRFDADLNYISTQIYLYLCKNYRNQYLTEIFIDVSSGQNIYVTAMLNALYRFLPFYQFATIYHESYTPLKAYIVNSDPIFTGAAVINIFLSEFRAKAFNTLTISNRSQLQSLVKKLRPDSQKAIRQIVEVEYPFLHTCINNGFVLGFTLLDKTLNTTFKQCMDAYYSDLFTLFNVNLGVTTQYKFSFYDIVSLTFLLELFHSFIQLIEPLEINDKGLCFAVSKEQKGGKLTYDVESPEVTRMYELCKAKLGLRHPGYKAELRIFKESMEKFIVFCQEGKAVSYGEFERFVKGMNYELNTNFNSRNFFAHFGFEKSITYCSLQSGNIFMKYADTVSTDQIKKQVADFAFKN